MNFDELSRPTKIEATTEQPAENSDDRSGEGSEAPRDPVQELCHCQHRYAELESDREALIERACLLGCELERNQEALVRFLDHPYFKERRRPPQPHHKLKPRLLAVQFVLSARTPNEQKYASWIARALKGLDGEDLKPGAVIEVLRGEGLDNLARTQATKKKAGEVTATGETASVPTTSSGVPEDLTSNAPAVPMAASGPTDSRVQSAPMPASKITKIGETGKPRSVQSSVAEPGMTVTVVGKGGRSRVFRCDLDPEIATALLSIPPEKSRYHTPGQLLGALIHSINKTPAQMRKGFERIRKTMKTMPVK